jgi:hypothetical protein
MRSLDDGRYCVGSVGVLETRETIASMLGLPAEMAPHLLSAPRRTVLAALGDASEDRRGAAEWSDQSNDHDGGLRDVRREHRRSRQQIQASLCRLTVGDQPDLDGLDGPHRQDWWHWPRSVSSSWPPARAVERGPS